MRCIVLITSKGLYLNKHIYIYISVCEYVTPKYTALLLQHFKGNVFILLKFFTLLSSNNNNNRIN